MKECRTSVNASRLTVSGRARPTRPPARSNTAAQVEAESGGARTACLGRSSQCSYGSDASALQRALRSVYSVTSNTGSGLWLPAPRDGLRKWRSGLTPGRARRRRRGASGRSDRSSPAQPGQHLFALERGKDREQWHATWVETRQTWQKPGRQAAENWAALSRNSAGGPHDIGIEARKRRLPTPATQHHAPSEFAMAADDSLRQRVEIANRRNREPFLKNR